MGKKLKDSRVADWEAYYASRGVEVDFSNIILPKYDDRLLRPLFMPAHREFPLNATLAMARQNYNVETNSGDDLDGMIIHNARSCTIGSYVVFARIGFEPDQEYLKKSAKEVDPFGMRGMNVRERTVLGDKVYSETGKHLDVEGWTRCSGSRTAGGNVPSMSWGDGSVRIRWTLPEASDKLRGIREVY